MKSNWLVGDIEIKKRDLLNKFTYQNEKKFPKIIKINLNFGHTKKRDFKNIARSQLALKLISGTNPITTKTRTDSTAYKIKKKSPAGSAVTLKKSEMKNFLSYLKTEALPKTRTNFVTNKTQKFCMKNKTFSFTLKNENLICFEEIEQNILLFKDIPALNVTFTFNRELKKFEKKILTIDFF